MELILHRKDSCNKEGVIVPKLKDFPINVIGVLISYKLIMLFNVKLRLLAISPHGVSDRLLD